MNEKVTNTVEHLLLLIIIALGGYYFGGILNDLSEKISVKNELNITRNEILEEILLELENIEIVIE